MGLYRWIFDFYYEKTVFFCIIDDKKLGQALFQKFFFPTSFLGLLSSLSHSNEVVKGQIAQSIMKIGLKGP